MTVSSYSDASMSAINGVNIRDVPFTQTTPYGNN